MLHELDQLLEVVALVSRHLRGQRAREPALLELELSPIDDREAPSSLSRHLGLSSCSESFAYAECLISVPLGEITYHLPPLFVRFWPFAWPAAESPA